MTENDVTIADGVQVEGQGEGQPSQTVAMAQTVTIQTTAKEFVAALKRSLKPARKTSLPMLVCAKIGDGTVTVTDLDITTVVPFEVIREKGEDGGGGVRGSGDSDGGRPGKGSREFLIPYYQTLNVLAGEDGPLKIEYRPLGEKVTYRLRDCEYEFESRKVENFPQTPKFPFGKEEPTKEAKTTAPAMAASGQTAIINGAVFCKLIDQTLFAVSKKESRYTTQGALLKKEGDKVAMVATDGHRLAMARGEGKIPAGSPDMLIRRDGLEYLRARTGEAGIEGEIVINVGNGKGEEGDWMFFETAGIQVAVRKLAGRFPNYQVVVDHAKGQTIRAMIPSAAKFLPVLLRVAKCADWRSGAVRLEFGKSLRLSATSTDNGTAKADFPCAATGELAVKVDSKYLAEFLKIVGDKPVEVGLKNAQSAMKFSADGFDYLLMPLHG